MSKRKLEDLFELWVNEKNFVHKKEIVRLGNQNVSLTLNFHGYISELIAAAFIKSETAEVNFFLDIYMPDCFDELLFDLSSQFDNSIAEVPYPFALTAPLRMFISSEQGSIYLYNIQTKQGLIFLRKSEALDQRSFITPFRLMLSWMAEDKKAEVLHASAFSQNGKALLINGTKGSGKSTLSLVAAMNGFNIIADDAVLVENQTVFALYSRAKIEESNSFTSRYLENSFRLMNNTEAKQILPLCSLESGFEFSARVKNIVFPTRSEQSQLYSANYEKFKQLFLDNSLREIFGGDKNNSIRHSQIYDSFQNFELKASIDMERNLKLLSGLLST